MRGITVAVLAAAGLAACSPAAEKQRAPAEAANGCAAHVATAWRTAGGGFAVSATTAGVDCAHATATLSMRDGESKEVYTAAASTADIMTLAPAHDVDAMQTALAEWIDPAQDVGSTKDLPAWGAGAENPLKGEFPFYPEENVTRDAYEALRAANAPMFCYVQGMESQACIAWTDGHMIKVGVQTFPG
ncbi:MAG TPA: hypothetical protein VG943_05860 [Caulobacterales bacterium]|nr:hypothetical protein [Caulobacterales bacterium]